MIKKIISGGQPGVERAALDAAIKLGLPHEGWAHKDRKKETGISSDNYNLRKIDKPSYFERLEKNIIDSEGIVILTHGQLIIGLRGVKDLANKHKRPCLHIDLNENPLNWAISSIRKWMTNNELEIVYFTGSKPIAAPNLNQEVIQIIEGICRMERERESPTGFQNEDNHPETEQ